MFTTSEWADLQAEQFRHDQRNHSDIICLPKPDRLKHYGLHFAKYVGRLARKNELKTPIRTMTDTALVALSAANTLHQRLVREEIGASGTRETDLFLQYADAAGRFADACEKIDHLEDFITIAKDANIDIIRWVIAFSDKNSLSLRPLIVSRREELAERQFYVRD